MTKYGNRRVNTPDGWFDSHRELARWQELKLLERAGKISSLQRQVRFEIVKRVGKARPTFYIADFVYQENGREVVEDSKGYRDRLYLLKRKLMLERHGIEVLES